MNSTTALSSELCAGTVNAVKSVGGSVETSSHIHGLFQYVCEAFELVLFLATRSRLFALERCRVLEFPLRCCCSGGLEFICHPLSFICHPLSLSLQRRHPLAQVAKTGLLSKLDKAGYTFADAEPLLVFASFYTPWAISTYVLRPGSFVA